MEPCKKSLFYNHKELVKIFLFGRQIECSSSSKAAVITKTIAGWIKFRKHGDLLD